MDTVVIVIHLMVVVALVGIVLLQRSEGGALGIGGGNAFLSGRGQGNVLTRATTILGIVFFATSIGMTVLGRLSPSEREILEEVVGAPAPDIAPLAPLADPAPASDGAGILDQLPDPTGQPAASDGQVTTPQEPQVPTSQ